MDFIDIVIPYCRTPRQDQELLYSLRSIQKHLKNYRNIFLIGDLPIWPIRNVFHVELMDRYGHERNIMEKTLLACKQVQLSDEFLFWNDDFFLVADTLANKYPFYAKGQLIDAINGRRPGDGYRRSLENSFYALKARGYQTVNFDIHTPIRYNKNKFEKIMLRHDWTISNGYVIKSLYANSTGQDPVYIDDFKIGPGKKPNVIEELMTSRHIFSISDKSWDSVRPFLERLFPEKSLYEI